MFLTRWRVWVWILLGAVVSTVMEKWFELDFMGGYICGGAQMILYDIFVAEDEPCRPTAK